MTGVKPYEIFIFRGPGLRMSPQDMYKDPAQKMEYGPAYRLVPPSYFAQRPAMEFNISADSWGLLSIAI
jgi:hypothetical protein